MLIAVFSDVHGNTPALEAVLQAIASDHPDIVVNLGDLASGGVDPAGTLERLRDCPEIVTIGGNHERQLTTLTVEQMSRSDRLAHAVMTVHDHDWLASLPTSVELTAGVLAFHGSPDDDLCYLLETVEPEGLREATDAEVLDRLGAAAERYDVHLCGHTHLQRARTLTDGSLVVNPGSVGWPAFADDEPYPHKVEAGTPHARFALIRSDKDGWRAETRAIEYDYELAAAQAERNQRPDVARALRTGRV